MQTILKIEKKCDVTKTTARIYEDITPLNQTNRAGQDETVYIATVYEIPISYKPNLAAEIELNYDEWLIKAKNYDFEQRCETVRQKRDMLLNECDIKYCNSELWDLMSENKKTEWREYKRALRDITTQEGFPYKVVFPKIPTTTEG